MAESELFLSLNLASAGSGGALTYDPDARRGRPDVERLVPPNDDFSPCEPKQRWRKSICVQTFCRF